MLPKLAPPFSSTRRRTHSEMHFDTLWLRGLFAFPKWIIIIRCVVGSPDVEFCGYTMPHPTTHQVNVRVQTTGMIFIKCFPVIGFEGSFFLGKPASQALDDSLDKLVKMCEHAQNTYEEAIAFSEQ